MAGEMGVLKMGTIGLDGTKIHANASRHSALSYEYAGKLEAQLKAEVADLMAKAEAADAGEVPDGMSIPDELARREERLRKIAEAWTTIEARAKERHAREKAEHEAKMAAREAKTAATGKKPGGKPPAPPTEGPLPTDQVNLTDEASRIMPAAGAASSNATMRKPRSLREVFWWWPSISFRRPTTSSRSNRCWRRSERCPKAWARSTICWPTPAISARAPWPACEKAGVEPVIAMGRQPHHPPLSERFEKAPAAPDDPTPVEAMAHHVNVAEGGQAIVGNVSAPAPGAGVNEKAKEQPPALGYAPGIEMPRRVEAERATVPGSRRAGA